MNVIKASSFGDTLRSQISEIFVDGFYQWLHFFSKDKNKLKNAFKHMFNLEVFYVAVIDNNVLGISACANDKQKSVRLQRKEFTKYLGFFKGNLAYLILKREFEQKQYPFPIEQNTGMIEFVATAINHRQQGVAKTIINEIIKTKPYNNFVLEVADTNSNALRLYEKLGFKEFFRVKEKHSKRSGVNNLIYMKKTIN